MAADYLTFYKSRLNKKWRWKYQASGNFEKLANGGESYGRLSDAMESAFRVTSLGNPWQTGLADFTPNDTETTITRDNGSSVIVRFR